MTISKDVYIERVLIVLNPDGTIKGAHSEAMETIRDGDVVMASRMLPAKPVTGDELATVLPDQAALLAQVQSLSSQLATATAERDALAAKGA